MQNEDKGPAGVRAEYSARELKKQIHIRYEPIKMSTERVE